MVTRKRSEAGECFVALLDGILVGTVTVYRGGRASRCVWYAQRENASMGQLAVEPPLQGRGLGAALMDVAERLGDARTIAFRINFTCDLQYVAPM